MHRISASSEEARSALRMRRTAQQFFELGRGSSTSRQREEVHQYFFEVGLAYQNRE